MIDKCIRLRENYRIKYLSTKHRHKYIYIVCVCVCVCVRERESLREIARVCVRAYVCVCERETEIKIYIYPHDETFILS